MVDVDDPDDHRSEVRDVAEQEAREVAEEAGEQAKEVAESARSGAVEVIEEAKHQASDLIDDARAQLHGQARQQTDQLGRTIEDLGDKLHALADGRPEDAGQVADYTDRLADQVEQLGGRVSELGFDGTIDELQRFARRRPGMFLLGATAAGFAVARLGRGAKDAQPREQPSGESPEQFTTATSRAEPPALGHGTSPTVRANPSPAASPSDTNLPGGRP